MNHFSSFLVEAEEAPLQPEHPGRVSDSVVTTFGRHNPPHLGHGKTFDFANDIAGNEEADQRFYTSRAQDAKKNPLPYEMKVDHLTKRVPQHEEKWGTEEGGRTILGEATRGTNKG